MKYSNNEGELSIDLNVKEVFYYVQSGFCVNVRIVWDPWCEYLAVLVGVVCCCYFGNVIILNYLATSTDVGLLAHVQVQWYYIHAF